MPEYSIRNLRIEAEQNLFRIQFDACVSSPFSRYDDGYIDKQLEADAQVETLKLTIETHVRDLPATTQPEWREWSRKRLLELLGSTLPKPSTDAR